MNEIINALKIAAKKIAAELQNADGAYCGNVNATGDSQLKLDVLSDQIIASELSELKSVKSIVSEEREAAIMVSSVGTYIVAYDPLDGSSLVDVNFAVGSIFGIYENDLDLKRLKAAVYFIYGPRLEMVLCEGGEVRLYRLNANGDFEFVRDLRLNEKGKLLAPGGTQKGWRKSHKKLIESLFDEGYRLRYSGAMVSDLHQILLKGGGLFSYPAGEGYENGKLRLAFEVAPFALIYEAAGGAAVSGDGDRILDIKISGPHQTTPCYFGSHYEIKKVAECKC